MKAVKKPIPIEVEEFQPDKLPWPGKMCSGTYEIKSPYAGAVFYRVFNELHNSWINVNPGDYLNVSDKTGRDIYPIDRATFERTYDVLP